MMRNLKAIRNVFVIQILFVLFVAVAAKEVKAYPNYISFGYQSCAACHFHPFGNGPLTDYGRSVAATAISERYFWDEKKTEDDIAQASGFMFKEPDNPWLRPSLSYRDLWLSRNMNSSSAKESFILMDLSAAVAIKFLEKDNLLFVLEGGYAPVPEALKNQSGIETYRSRQHYAAYRFNKNFGIYAGLMDKTFGLKIAEHTAYSRILTANTQNDQTHGVLFHFSNNLFEAGLHPFIGNLVQDEKLRHKGVSSIFEFSTTENSRSGVSFSYSSSSYTKLLSTALHSRMGFGAGNSFLAEFGRASRTAISTDIAVDSLYFMLQGHYQIKRGLFAGLLAEEKTASDSPGVVNFRFGPGLQFFPFQRLELRLDLSQAMTHVENGSGNRSLSASSQMHWWL